MESNNSNYSCPWAQSQLLEIVMVKVNDERVAQVLVAAFVKAIELSREQYETTGESVHIASILILSHSADLFNKYRTYFKEQSEQAVGVLS